MRTSAYFPIFALAWGLLLSACASGLASRRGQAPEAQRTVLLFLVDGFPALLQAAMDQDLMPHTRRYFLQGRQGFRLARASFPSLTYPNIASILTGRRIGEQPIIANQMYEQGRLVNYEEEGAHDHLREQIDSTSVIAAFEGAGKSTASFSYVFGLNAGTHIRFGLREGLEYKTQRYRDLDGRLLRNLERFLTKQQPALWPAFIYIHLVGVDATVHHHGSRSREALSYLAWLDQRLAPIYQRLAGAEQGGNLVESILTSDHGFMDTSRFVDLEAELEELAPRLRYTNESRLLNLYFPRRMPISARRRLLKKLGRIPGVELAALQGTLRQGAALELFSARGERRFAYGPALCEGEAFSLAPIPRKARKRAGSRVSARFHCLEQLPEPRSYPFLVADLAAFLSAPRHPDAVVVAGPGVSFTEEFQANHGGPSAVEMLVPLLLRNSDLPGAGLLRTSDLLSRYQYLFRAAPHSPAQGR